eukprot:6459933-Amphidinium_carterae.1
MHSAQIHDSVSAGRIHDSGCRRDSKTTETLRTALPQEESPNPPEETATSLGHHHLHELFVVDLTSPYHGHRC